MESPVIIRLKNYFYLIKGMSRIVFSYCLYQLVQSFRKHRKKIKIDAPEYANQYLKNL